MKGEPGTVQEAWVSASYESSKSGKRVLYGSIDRHAKRISRDHEVSVSTAKRRKPNEVCLASRATDLCGVCEELRSQRLFLARACGKSFPDASLGEGTCTMARELCADIREEDVGGCRTAEKMLARMSANAGQSGPCSKRPFPTTHPQPQAQLSTKQAGGAKALHPNCKSIIFADGPSAAPTITE